MNDHIPKGYGSGLDWGDWNEGEVTMWTPEPQKPLTKRCSCGTNIAMGYEAPLEFHSDWCDLKRED